MHPLSIFGLFAAIAAASPTPTGLVSELGQRLIEPDGREVYIVYGNETDAAIWDQEDKPLQARADVNYRCYSGGEARHEDVGKYVRRACNYLQGGYATGQEKKSCQGFDHTGAGSARGHYDFSCKNTVGGRAHDWEACVDRLTAILDRCYYGGRVNRANWEMRSDPQSRQGC